MLPASATPNRTTANLPDRVPERISVYLAHTEGGETIRALARARGQHPSTVLRLVRRTETLRDDPLVDAALSRLGRSWRRQDDPNPDTVTEQDPLPMMTRHDDDATFARDSFRILKALMEPNTLLVIADGVEDAVVVHNAGDDRPVRRAVLSRELAETLALNEFISGEQIGRLTRYRITSAGRAEVGRRMAESESRRAAQRGEAEDGAVVDASALFSGQDKGAARRRSAGAEAPLHVLARRRRQDGTAWLTPDLVAAGLRFRETYEIAQVGGGITVDWDKLIAGRVSGGAASAGPTRRLEAGERLSAAIRALGPDLAETVIMGICQEQGMEDIEQRLAFPARSGKIVMRIALRSLARHYAETASDSDDLIY